MNEILETPSAVLTVRERLIALVRNMLGSQGASRPLAVEARFSDIGISSVKMVNLMLAIEVEFDITIPQNEITQGNFESIASVEALVLRVARSAGRL